RNCDLTGAGINLPGEFPGLRTTITLHTVGGNTTIKLGSVLQKLNATVISASAIEAPTIGSVIVKAGITNSTITVTNGNVGAVRAAAIVDSSITAGYTPLDENKVFASGTFIPGLRIGSVGVRGPGSAFRNSFVIAARLGRA